MWVTRCNFVRCLAAILLAVLAMYSSSSGAAAATASTKNRSADVYDEVVRFSTSCGSSVEHESPASADATPFLHTIYSYDEVTRTFVGAQPSVTLLRPTEVQAFATEVAQQSGQARFAVLLAAKGVRSIDPDVVRFSQDSIKGTFKNGGTVDDLAAGLRSGAIKPGDVPAIRVVERDGQLFTLDNRRLEAFRRAGVPIRYRYATPQEAASEAFKFTTRNGGQSVRVRGG